MTYNQQRKFTTVNGAICSMVSFMLLLYLFSVTGMKYIFDPTFTHTYRTYVLSAINPYKFTVEQSQMIVLSRIVDSSGRIKAHEIE